MKETANEREGTRKDFQQLIMNGHICITGAKLDALGGKWPKIQNCILLSKLCRCREIHALHILSGS